MEFIFFVVVLPVVLSNTLSGLWYGPLFGATFVATMRDDRGHDWMQKSHSTPLCLALSSVCHALRAVFLYNVYVALGIAGLGVTAHAMRVGFVLHVGMTLTSVHQDVWQGRPLRLLVLNQVISAVNTMTTCATMLYFLESS